MMLPSRIALVAGLAACAMFLSCSDDPFVPGNGPYVPPEYQPAIESLDARFRSVCGTGPDNIYAVGDAIMHYDGRQWAPVELPVGLDFTPTAELLSDGTLAVIRDRFLYLYGDGAWTQLDRSPAWLERVWGRSRDDVYALTYDGLLHHDGVGWTTMNVPKPGELYSIAGNADGKVVTCGWSGRVDQFDGNDWSSAYLDSTSSYHKVAVTPSGRIFVAGSPGRLYELVDSTPVLIREDIREETLQADGEAIYVSGHYFYGTGNPIHEYANGTWRDVGVVDVQNDAVKVTRGQIFAVGWDNLIWQGDASGGGPVSLYPSRGRMYDAVTIGDATYVVGELAFRYQDGEWTDLDKQYITRIAAYGIGGRRNDDIYAVGQEMILHYDGATWEWVNSGLERNLRSVCVEANGNVVAVGSGPVLVEFDGETWSSREIHIPTVESYSFYDVVGVGSTVVVVGDNGLLGMRRGREWYFMRPTGASLYAVWGIDEQHIYAVTGADNRLLFFNGTRWDMITIEGPRLDRMVSIWGTSPSNLFVMDRAGSLARFNGREWSAEAHLLTDMYAVAGTERAFFAVGQIGVVSYRK